MRRIAIPFLIMSAFTFTACKKKQGEDAAKKPTEGSAVGSAAPAGSAAPSGSAAPAGPAAAGSGAPAGAGSAAPTAAKSILDTAKEAGGFTTLLKAIDAPALTERLTGAGPFTVLAPTDEAFAKLPPKDLEALLADKAKLEALLQRHVITGAVASKDLGAQKSVKSVGGDDLAVDATSGLKVAGATVVKPDIAASNGVIHVIDTVLVPPAGK